MFRDATALIKDFIVLRGCLAGTALVGGSPRLE